MVRNGSRVGSDFPCSRNVFRMQQALDDKLAGPTASNAFDFAPRDTRECLGVKEDREFP
jgi:hypothetical protein